MKNSFSDGRLSYSFMSRIHSNVLVWRKPASKSDRSKPEIENILRWEDDGGQMLDLGNRTATSNPDTARERANESRC